MFSPLKFLLWLQRLVLEILQLKANQQMSAPSPTVTKIVLTSLSAYIWLPAFFSKMKNPVPKSTHPFVYYSTPEE